ncbi:hypothetical protein [Collimonas sp. PA-H2]|uniref:hypothetical protein n=1 Tax=Collimonas sp. PA-H2 TaxID=1881062 RepID=UPI00117E01F2|nr:hypothetical protein [Collimonas sp. PA-H2]
MSAILDSVAAALPARTAARKRSLGPRQSFHIGQIQTLSCPMAETYRRRPQRIVGIHLHRQVTTFTSGKSKIVTEFYASPYPEIDIFYTIKIMGHASRQSNSWAPADKE